MDKDLTSIEVIGLAVRSEEDASKFYAHISKLIANPIIKEKYENLAKEEVSHSQILTELYKKMMGSDERPPQNPRFSPNSRGWCHPSKHSRLFRRSA